MPRPAAVAPAPATSAPAVAPKAASAAPAPKPTATIAADGPADAEAAVRAWARAWARRDMAAYYAAYEPGFKGQAGSRKAWEQDRRDRIATRKQIKVELQDLRVSVNGDQATAKFRQVYSSDALSATSRKTLQLVRGSNGRWQIRQESVGN
jgi:ketosteroid isomerase-like protein